LRERLIAVIDDDESFRMALVESLRSLGYGARGFASAEDFIAGEADASYDCVITDIHMPGMSGLDLARLLTERPRGVPVVMVTARQTWASTLRRRPRAQSACFANRSKRRR
jgi:FixJ family two-component response regulator